MKNKKSVIERLSSGKGFYITAACSFALIVTAIGFVYNSSANLLEGLEIPTTVKQAEKIHTGISDPRQSTKTPTTAVTTKKVTEKPSEKPTEKKTEATEATTLPPNNSYIFPLSGDRDRGFSLSPVYDETMEDWRVHTGLDLLAEKGSNVVSIGNGKVTKVISHESFGYCIEVDYGEFTARYCGIEQGTAVGIGDSLSRGDLIGKLGDIPCESAQESHLHFEIVAKNGSYIDPLSVLSE